MTTSPPPGPPAYNPPPYGPSPYPQQPYSQQPGAGGKPRLRGRTPRRLSIIFLVAAIAAFVAGGIVLATKSLGKVDGFERVKLDSISTVTFNRIGNYVAYYEADNVSDSTRSVPVVPVAIESPSGVVRDITTPYGGRSDNRIKVLTYQNDGHNGVALYQFKVTEKGRYRVQVGTNTAAAANADIAFGQSIAGGTVVGALLIVLGVLLLIAAIVLLIVGLVKRSRHKRELSSGGYPGGPPPGGQWGPPQPGGQYPQYGQQPGYGQPGQYPPPGYPPPGYPPPAGSS